MGGSAWTVFLYFDADYETEDGFEQAIRIESIRKLETWTAPFKIVICFAFKALITSSVVGQIKRVSISQLRTRTKDPSRSWAV